MANPIRLRHDRKAGVALLTGVAMAPLLLSAGIAIDLARQTQFRMALQGAADSASLAGSAVYNGTGNATAATTAARNYMLRAEASLPSNNGVSYTITPQVVTNAQGQTSGYTVAVAASGTIPTTILSLITPSVGASVGAKGLNPVITINASLGNWKSSAWDANTVYWYIVPPNGALPATSALHMMFTNTGPAPASLPPITVTATDKIGFVLKNVTGGIHGYGPNQYGSAQGHTNWIYSQLSPPSANAYPTVARNCALQVVVASPSNPTPTQSPGGCASATPANATVNCTQMPGQSIYFFWNDMGGGRDDYDYNDAQYSITCGAPSGGSVSASSPTGVVLVQ
ncbi:MAG: Tad domain-containing protein [Rhodospirillales bacterium]|nr:Tad domain-containing protein [Rhodospirillales bacterium]